MKNSVIQLRVAGSAISSNTLGIYEVLREYSVRTYVQVFAGIFFLTGLLVICGCWL
jgi:hypothetical protein